MMANKKVMNTWIPGRLSSPIRFVHKVEKCKEVKFKSRRLSGGMIRGNPCDGGNANSILSSCCYRHQGILLPRSHVRRTLIYLERMLITSIPWFLACIRSVLWSQKLRDISLPGDQISQSPSLKRQEDGDISKNKLDLKWG